MFEAAEEMEGGMGAFDIIQEHLNRAGQSERSPANDNGYSGLDEEELRKYLASPQSVDASTPQDATDAKTTAMAPVESSSTDNSNANEVRSQQSLEGALAALGETGRQQLLAILQLATGNSNNKEEKSRTSIAASPADLRAPSAQPGRPDHASTTKTGARSTKTPVAGFQFPSSSSASAVSNSREQSQDGPSPAYFANAFNQYSRQAQYPGNALINGNSSSSGASGSGSASGSGGSVHRDGSTPGSSSSKTSPALGAIGSSSYSASKPSGHAERFKHSSSSSTSASAGAPVSALDNIAFTLPDSNYYRSPGMAPGTSSSAFYTESGLGDDGDLLFTPLVSPALTASTQPGPSVGPLPESFSHLGKDFSTYGSSSNSNKQYGGNSNNYSASTGVSPMHFWSPLSSPALRPQVESGSQQQQFQAPSSSARQSSSGHVSAPSSTHSRRGASKNNPKTRPSPIMRPLDTNASHPGSGKSSKRSSIVAQSPAHSNPTSPVYATAPYGSFSNLSKIHEYTAQNAIKDSPSPHQFDLSSTESAAAMIAAALQYQQQYHNAAIASQQQQQQLQQQQASQSSSASGNTMPHRPQQYNQDGSTAFGAANVPSPLDLNSIFGMMGPQAVSNGFASKPEFNASPDNTGIGMDSSAAINSNMDSQASIGTGFDLAEYAAFFQNEPQKPDSTQSQQSPQLHPRQQQDLSSMTQYLASDASIPGSARMTPASFMNLPQNQYNLLTGLLADQSQQPPLHSSLPPSAYPSAPASANTSPIFPAQFEHRPQPPSHPNNKAAQYQARSANSSTGTVKQAISPAIVAQNIKEVAAAAIAAKEAKSAAKGRGGGRKRAKSSAVAGAGESVVGASASTATAASTSIRKTGKRAAAQAAENNYANQDDEAMDTSFRVPHNLTNSASNSVEQSPVIAPENRKSSHKVAEQRRRDSLKLCFEELRFILPPINPDEDEDFAGGSKRPGENNVGGQRGRAHNIDPKHPNKGISKVAMLRKSNEYVTKLHARVDNRDAAIQTLREELRACRVALGQGLPGNDAHLDALSAVNWQELAEDVDPVAPTYKLHGLCAPGSTLVYRFTQPSIPEEVAENAQDTAMNEDEQDEIEQDEEEEEYKVKKTRRTSSTSQAVSTRNNARNNIPVKG